MGVITPVQGEQKKNKSAKKLLSDCLKTQMLEEVCIPHKDGSTTCMTRAEAIGLRLLNIAIFSVSDKTATTAAKVISEMTEGRPAVKEENKNTDIPIVKFLLKSDDQKLVDDRLANATEEVVDSGVFKVDLGNGEGVEIPVEEE